MKKYQLTVMLLFLSFAVPCLSQQVTMQEASRAAISIMRKETRGDTNIYMQSINYHRGENGEVLLYEVFLSNGTSVLLSGNRNCVPLLAINYNPETSILDTLNDCPKGVKDFLFRYTFQIKQQYLSRAFCQANQTEWDKLQQLDTTTVQAPRAPVYGPFTTTKWEQASPYNNYVQDYCNSGGRCLVGCTAVAMGQIMKYWNYPIVRYDTYKQFDWCNMPDVVSTSTEIDAVSWLLYQCAEAIDMHYCVDNDCESLGWPSDVPDALRSWGYVDSIRLDERGLTSYSTWSQMIIRELEAKRPVLYAGIAALVSIYGHSFVCDGYNSGNSLFHFNWGWRGTHNNEWFRIDDLSPNSHNYSHQERIVRYISPANPINYCNSQLSLEEFYHNFYSIHVWGYNNNTPSSLLVPTPYMITPQTIAFLKSASATSRSEFRTIPNNVTATYQAYKEIVLRDGFTAEQGCDFTARIEPCARCEERAMTESDTPDLASSGNDNQDNSDAPMVFDNNQQSTSDGLYPNPTDGQITVIMDGEAQAIIIYTTDGRPVGGWKLLSFSDRHATLDVSILPDGLYLLSVQTSSGTKTYKLSVTH